MMSDKMTTADLIRMDTAYVSTPELPSMRYRNRSIPVFLWDSLVDYQTFSKELPAIKMGNSYRLAEIQALTKELLLPWYGLKERGYPAYCLADAFDLTFLSASEYVFGEPLQVQGKLIEVDLSGLIELDVWYQNEVQFSRTLIDVVSNSGKVTKAYAYFNEMEDIAEWDQSKAAYTLDDDIDVTPFTDVVRGKKDVYKF